MSSVAASNRQEPQTCTRCGNQVPPSRLCFERVAGELRPRCVECPRDAQPARLSGGAT